MAKESKFRKGMIMPTLITQLKGILEQYPDDGQILKELIQNAEDAGASKVVFLMDHNTYGTEMLHHRDMSKYQGPALYAYNDAMFTDKDWEGIRTLYDSVKADDPLKVGKFGLGFKSIFHVTDLPSIYSGQMVGYLDPHKRFFEVNVEGQSQAEKTTSFDWNFENEEDMDNVNTLSDQFQPYKQKLFGVNDESFRSGNFAGTMFRFPLRNKNMQSDLSKIHYDADKVQDLFQSMSAESETVILFLKNIKFIAFYEQTNDTITKLMEIKISNESQESTNIGRMTLSRKLNENADEWYAKDSFTVSYQLTTEVSDSRVELKSTTWLITQHFGGKDSEPTTEQSIDRYLPLVGIASKLANPNDTNIPGDGSPYGQLFCFMPLPLEEKSPTGFYFHVNGSFAVDQNRRHLKWRTVDQDLSKMTDRDLIWNNFLIEKLLPVCLVKQFECLVNEHKKLINKNKCSQFLKTMAHDIYSVLPNEFIANHRWKGFIDKFKGILMPSLELFSVTTLKWHPKMSHIVEKESVELIELQIRILTEAKCALAYLSSHVVRIVSQSSSPPLSAHDVCKWFKTIQDKNIFSEDDKILLLKYFCKNLKNIQELIGIQLLPLSDDTWISFENHLSENKIFVFNDKYPEDLFPFLMEKFLCLNKVPSNFFDITAGLFNLHQIDEISFASIIHCKLREFGSEQIKLNSPKWFTHEWLEGIWMCLKRDFKDSLNNFIGLHLLLVTNGRVMKLTQQPAIIGSSFGEDVHPKFTNLCNKLDIEICETHNDDIYSHPCLWGKSVLPKRLKSILKFFIEMDKRTRDARIEKLNTEEIEYFINCLSKEIDSVPLTEKEKYLLRDLKFFKTVDKSKRMKSLLVSLNEVNIAVEYSILIPNVPSYVQLLDLSKSSMKKLAVSLSIQLLNLQCLMDKAYIPGIQSMFYCHEEIQTLTEFICEHFKDISFLGQQILRSLNFVIREDESGCAKPSDLFDHNDEVLQSLQIKNFPNEKWRHPKYYDALIALGLKSSNMLSRNDCINIIQELSVSSGDFKRYDALLNFLENNTRLLDECLRNEIINLNWVRFRKSKPHGYPSKLKYHGSHVPTTRAKIDEVISSKFAKVVGSTCLLVDTKNYVALENFLGWNKRPPLSSVVQHLQNLALGFESFNMIELLDFLKEIYAILNTYPESDLKVELRVKFPWVWTGSGFAYPDGMIRSELQIDTRPFIFGMTKEFLEFENLWESVNVPMEVDFPKLLKQIKEYHESASYVDKFRVDRDLNLAVTILNRLAETNATNHADVEIYVPTKTDDTTTLKMERIENCAYCDKAWYKNGFTVDDIDDNVHLIHDRIPLMTAEKLKIASCLSKILNVEDFQCIWGQTEPLTTRLKNILKDYSDGSSVFKELIQNADDAGATEVNFVYDERTNDHHRTILIDDKMKDLQGPAIWCHNDATFSEDDFVNIKKLGGATKESAAVKIGKFGIGFNVVYHLTDVPVFVSNDSIVFFDPQFKYLGNAITSKGSPGIRLKFKGNQMKINKLKDQFAPFNGLFGCDFSRHHGMEKYNGTLFRFPLRTLDQANTSEICNKHYDKGEVVQLIECLVKSGDELLLFTQNICKINLYHIDNYSTLQNIFHISRRITEIIQNLPRVKGFSYMKSVLPSKSECAAKEFVYIADIASLFTNNSLLTVGKGKNDVWCIGWTFGTDESFEMCMKDQTLLPIGAVAARLELSNGDSWILQTPSERKFFCFLPLPSSSTLPLHVNGYFALNSSRTQMFTRLREDKIDNRQIWNEALMKDAVTSAYCNMLKCLAEKSVENLYDAFPGISCWQDNCYFAESVYSKLFDANLKVFRSIVDGEFYSFIDCKVVGKEIQEKDFYDSIKAVIKSVGSLKNIVVIILPSNVYKCISMTIKNNVLESQKLGLQEFYEEWFLQHLSTLDLKEVEEIVLETLFDSNINKFLIKHACIPVTPLGDTLKSIDQLINPNSIIGQLYDGKDKMFPFVSKRFEKKKDRYIEILVSLGLRNELSCNEIIERCQAIENCPETMLSRLPMLLTLIESYLNNINCKENITEESQYLIEQIQYVKMFPIKSKPLDYPLSWKQCKSNLVSSNEGFLENKMQIAAPSCLIIDEDLSFKGSCSKVKERLNLLDKFLSLDFMQIFLLDLKSHFDKYSNFSLKEESEEKVFAKIVKEFQKEIDHMIRHDVLHLDDIKRLSKMRFILSNDSPARLLLPRQCSEHIHKPLAPYLYRVTETSMSSWKSMWTQFGINKYFNINDCVKLLKLIERNHRKAKLDRSTLELVLNTLESISDGITKRREKRPKIFYVPNKKGILSLNSQLKYNDCQWSELSSDEYCHDKISKSLADSLGIQSVRASIIFSSTIKRFPFGQREELINRINRILEGYQLNESFFREMIQNADDACASAIHFVNDQRILAAEKIFSDRWKHLQGPALSIYNDKSFTLEDLEGIQKLGEGSKRNDISKTGQYGIGFNCVYHLTDVPSFMTTVNSEDGHVEMSGTVLGVFDPNCCFLPEANFACPGGLFNGNEIAEKFPHVYHGYLQDIEKYNVDKFGTLFRLPLRNENTKNLSKLQGKLTDIDEIDKLFESYGKETQLTLLFLKSLESIQLTRVKHDESSNTIIQNIREVNLHLTEENKIKKNAFNSSSREIIKALQNEDIGLQDIRSQEVFYEASLCDEFKSSKWLIVQRFGFEDASEISNTLLCGFNNGTIKLQPLGGVALDLDRLQFSKEMNHGKIFSLLPISQATSLPVHINGHFVLDHENRKQLLVDENHSLQTEWNEEIMRRIIAPAYCTMLSHVKDNAMMEDFNVFYKLFPKHESGVHINILTTEIYRYIYRNKLELFLVYKPSGVEGKEWTCLDENVYFEDLESHLMKESRYISERFLDNNRKKAEFLKETLYSIGMTIIDGPSDLFKRFQDANIGDVNKIAAENVLNNLRSSPVFNDLPQSVQDTPFKSVQGVISVIQYVKYDSEKEYDFSILKNLPILLTADNVLRKVTFDSELFESKYQNLVPHKLSNFIHKKIEHLFCCLFKETKIVRKLTVPHLVDLLSDFNVPLFSSKLLKFEEFCEHFRERSECLDWIKSFWKFIDDVLKDCNHDSNFDITKNTTHVGIPSSTIKNAKKFNALMKTKPNIDESLDPLKHLKAIPVTIKGVEILFPLGKRSCILRPLSTKNECSKDLFDSMKDIGVPLLNMNMIDGLDDPRRVLDLFGDVHNPENILAALEDVYLNLKQNNISSFTQGYEILRHLSDNVKNFRQYAKAKCILSLIPFYVDKGGHQVSLTNKNVYVIPKDIPHFDIDATQRSCMLLRSDPYLSDLYKFLGFPELTSKETYVKFIFLSFPTLNPSDRFKHLEFINKIRCGLPESEQFLEALKNLQFIDHQGCLRKASYFFCNKNRIFKIMENKFLSPPFDSVTWKDFLIVCGLTTELSTEKFLEYAIVLPSLEFDTSQVQTLMINWLSNKGQDLDDIFVKRLKSIPFLHQADIDKNLLTICPRYKNSSHIPFENSFEGRFSDLCWTVSNVLPFCVSRLNPKFLARLSVCMELDLKLVIKNLSNISIQFEKFVKSNKQLDFHVDKPMMNLIEKHFTWLERHKLDNHSLKALKEIKCLYIEEIKELVRPNQIAIDIAKDDQILPFIFRIPGFCGKYENLLSQLGATKNITIEQCARSLQEIKDIVGDQKMDPNKKNIANRLFVKFLDLMRSCDPSELIGLNHLFVPCSGDILCDSAKIYCTSNEDANEFADGLDIPLVILQLDYIELLTKLPESIKPKHLEDFLEEKMAFLGENVHLSYIENIQQNMKHPNFMEGLIRLKKHLEEAKDDGSQNLGAYSDLLSGKLNGFSFIGQTIIQTQKVFNGIPINKCLKEVSHLMHQNDLSNNLTTIYISSSVGEGDVLLDLSKTLATYFEISTKYLEIKEILCRNPDSIPSALDRMGIKSVASIYIPPLGNEILMEYHFSLVQDIIIFHPKQLAAYEVDDPEDRGQDGEPKYILVEVVRRLDNQISYSKFDTKYEINAGNQIMKVSAINLYAFETRKGNQFGILVSAGRFDNACSNNQIPSSLADIIKEMKAQLKEIWKLDESDRKKAMRRLLLKYHPDKNPECAKEMYNEAFKHFMILLGMLEKGLSIDNYYDDTSIKEQNSHQAAGRDYFERMNRRAQQHKYTKQRTGGNGGYRNMFASSSSSARTFFSNASRQRKSDPVRAKLFMDQAIHDLGASSNDIRGSKMRSPQWRCIKLYQATKNGIMAVCFSKDSLSIPMETDKLRDMCSEIYDKTLVDLVEEVDAVLKGHDHLTRPSARRPAFENVTDNVADAASGLVERILICCRELVARYTSY